MAHNIYHAYLPLIHFQIASFKPLTANVFSSKFSRRQFFWRSLNSASWWKFVCLYFLIKELMSCTAVLTAVVLKRCLYHKGIFYCLLRLRNMLDVQFMRALWLQGDIIMMGGSDSICCPLLFQLSLSLPHETKTSDTSRSVDKLPPDKMNWNFKNEF